jgi:hypothetical protein
MDGGAFQLRSALQEHILVMRAMAVVALKGEEEEHAPLGFPEKRAATFVYMNDLMDKAASLFQTCASPDEIVLLREGPPCLTRFGFYSWRSLVGSQVRSSVVRNTGE